MLLWNEPTQALWFLLTSLATWRCARFLVREEGPFDLGTRMRGLFVKWGAVRLISCPHCISVWLALGWVGLVYRPQAAWLVLVPAVAAVSSIVELHLSGAQEPTEFGDE